MIYRLIKYISSAEKKINSLNNRPATTIVEINSITHSFVVRKRVIKTAPKIKNIVTSSVEVLNCNFMYYLF